MATLSHRISSALTARASSYYATRSPTNYTVSFGSQYLEYASAGFWFALMSYIIDLLSWSSLKYTVIVGYTTLSVASAPTSHRFPLTAGLHLGAIVTSFALCRWNALDCPVSIYTAINLYCTFLEVVLIRFTILDQPTDRIDAQIALTQARALSHFVTAALLFRPRKVFQYVFSHFWSCDSASYVFLSPLLLEFLYEFAVRWPVMGLSWESIYESFVATQTTVRLLDHYFVEYRSRLSHSLRMEYRKYMDSRDHDVDIPPFDYTLVPMQKDEIRLIRLPRRSWNPFVGGMLQIKLISVPLSEANDYGYEALSYTWGPEFPQKPILIMGKRHMVRQNLYNLLHARRSVFYDRVLWVDALCIDQNNDAEKQNQISKMKDIYIDADRVLAWLDDTFDAWMAVHTIINISNKFQMWNMQADQLLNSFDRNSPHWKAFMKYILHSYFSRAWICQEAGLGHDLQFYIAGAYIPFEAIWYAMIAISQAEVLSNLCRENDLLGNNDIDALKNIHTTLGLRPWDSQTPSDKKAVYPLGLILSVSSRFKATDPRDKIYAFLGISNSKVAKSIEPRPKAPIPELFHSTAIKLLESEDDAEYVLPHAGIRPAENSTSPSWAPDWVREAERNTEVISIHVPPGIENVIRMVAQAEAEDLSDILEQISGFKYAAGGMSKPMFQIDSTETRLQTLAVPADRIAAQTDRSYNHLSINEQVHQDWLTSAEQLALNPSAALARTLVGNRLSSMHDPRPTPSPKILLNAYNTFKRSLILGGVELQTAQYRSYRILLGESVEDAANPGPGQPKDVEEPLRAALDFASRMKTICGGRRVCRTADGRLGVVPATTQIGDEIFVIRGMQTPYVLHAAPAENSTDDVWYRIVGECYIDGIMEGQAINEEALRGITII